MRSYRSKPAKQVHFAQRDRDPLPPDDFHLLSLMYQRRFIFVEPPGNMLACPVPDSDELLDLSLYSAEVEVT